MKHALFTLALLFALALPASAQDETETPAPPTPTVEATAVVTEIPIPDDGDVIIVEPPSDGNEISINVVVFASIIITSVLAGGGILAVLYRIMDRREAQDAVEKFYEAASPEQQAFIRDVVTGYKELSDRLVTFMEKVTDGLPNA